MQWHASALWMLAQGGGVIKDPKGRWGWCCKPRMFNFHANSKGLAIAEKLISHQDLF